MLHDSCSAANNRAASVSEGENFEGENFFVQSEVRGTLA